MSKHLLLLSSSKADQTDYLVHATPWIKAHCEGRPMLFIPYAGVGMSHADYTHRVKSVLEPAGIDVDGIEQYADPKQAIREASCLVVGGGNTFVLLTTLYKLGLLDLIRQRAHAGLPYIGWSAGSNLAGLSIRTTNDMPIVEPPSFRALALLPLQINPHYSDFQPPGFHGETREQRLREFMHVDGHTPVIGLQEGSAIRVSAGKMSLLGEKSAYLFQAGDKRELSRDSDLSFLL